MLADEVNEQERLNLLDKAIEELPAQQKRIWQMSRVQRMKYADIAAELGIGKDAVNKSLQAATRNITNFVMRHLHLLLLLLFFRLQDHGKS